ncbi:MAG: tRNA dimethylallyltransferase [Roseivirga sp.]
MKNFKYLVSIVGPTAVGKTALSIQLANEFACGIISADSRQFYRELEIGTAKPNQQELAAAHHHLINSLSIHDDYNVGNFETDTLAILANSYVQSDMMVMVGGSGLFVNAVCYGMDDLPVIKEGERERIISELNQNGLACLNKELEEKDPEYFSKVDLKNPQRVMRALEVIRSTGKSFSEFRSGTKVERPFKTIWIGLEMDRKDLYDRINLRMDHMIANGLFEEAKKHHKFKHLNALQTVGYKEIFGYLDGEYDREEAIRLLKRNSRRYAKRQMTWFKRNEGITWFSPNDYESITKFISESQGN